MERKTCWLFPVVCICALAQADAGRGELTAASKDPTGADAINLAEMTSESEVPADEFLRLPPGLEIRRHYYGPRAEADALREITGEVVYANTGGTMLIAPGSNRLIADDVTTAAVSGCNMSGYEILVGVYGSEGGGASYTVDFGIYDDCPGANPPGELIPGTEGSMTFEDDGALHLVMVDLEGSEIPMENNFWIGAMFTGNPNAGWIGGVPADIGFTQDVYDYPHPSLRCIARFGGTNLHAGYYAKVYCTGEFDMEFPAYLNPELDGIHISGQGIAGLWLADDLHLIVDDCLLTSYEVAVRGDIGPFIMDAELWQALDPATVIEGTQGVFQGIGDGSNELVRFTFPGGLPLPTDSLWVALRFDQDFVGPIIAEEATVGFSGDMIGVCLPDGGGCFTQSLGGEPQASCNAAINCLGSPPSGACCEIVGSEWTCRQTPQISCVGPNARWIEGAACDPDPFDPPCGGFACCLPDPWPRGSCVDLTEEDCIAAGGVWDGRNVCNNSGQDCGWFPCRDAEGSCCAEHDSVGCTDFSCCSNVCEIDSFCCEWEWDDICTQEAIELCCPESAVTWWIPPNGVVDARQPHPVHDGTDAQGIDTIRGIAAPGATACCWELCETDEGESPNFIAEIEAGAGGVYTFTLDRPITPGAVTTIDYAGSLDREGRGRFISHPGNVNGDGQAGPADVLALVDVLDRVATAPWDDYSCDVDRSGTCDPLDILRVLDLLNGAGAFVPYNGTELPSESGICP